MQAIYNFHWDASTTNYGINYYVLTVNGSTNYVYGTSFQMNIEENTNVHAEVYAIDYIGQMSDPAVIDFMVPDFIEAPVRPGVPGNFGVDFVNWVG
jgi:hypothetical protein